MCKKSFQPLTWNNKICPKCRPEYKKEKEQEKGRIPLTRQKFTWLKKYPDTMHRTSDYKHKKTKKSK